MEVRLCDQCEKRITDGGGLSLTDRNHQTVTSMAGATWTIMGTPDGDFCSWRCLIEFAKGQVRLLERSER